MTKVDHPKSARHGAVTDTTRAGHVSKTRSIPAKFGPLSAFFALNATVFISSGCIMMIELVAGRIISRHLGSSVYTWTSVIGIVLAGIAVGNYIGGLIADQFSSRQTLAKLFMAASGMAAAITMLDNIAANWSTLWMASWPVRVAMHVFIAFFFPCAVLGMISPIVGKMALELGRQKGRTIGDIYAWGVVGSLCGTFLAGFYLIAALGSKPLVWTVGGILGVMAILYWIDSWKPRIWLGVLLLLATFATASPAWARSLGEMLLLRDHTTQFLVYADESNYSNIEIFQITKEPDVRGMLLDTLLHSQIDIDNPANFYYEYERVYAAITLRMRRNAPHVDSLTIGGGGYVYPRYMDARWPGSHTDVAEIDPAVTEASFAAFGLSRDTPIHCYHEDGRVMMNRLLEQKQDGKKVSLYDFIYCDAVHDYNVPFQLTSREFMQSAFELTKPDGAFLMNMIDMFDSGRFLGSLVNTMKDVFPYVYVFCEGAPVSAITKNRNTFIIAGMKQPFDTRDLGAEYHPSCRIFPFTEEEMSLLAKKAAALTLSDQYSPVENLLAEVVRDAAKTKAMGEWLDRVRRAIDREDYPRAIALGRESLALLPDETALACELGRALRLHHDINEAISVYKDALVKKPDYFEAHLGLIECYTDLKDMPAAFPHYKAAVEQRPLDIRLRYNYAVALLEANDAQAALNEFMEINKIKDCYTDSINNTGVAFFKLGRLEEAVAQFVKTIHCEHAHKDAWGNLGFIMSQGKVPMSKVVFDDPGAYIRLGDELYQRRQAQLAKEAFEKVLAIDPKYVPALFGVANSLAAMGDLEGAKKAYQAVLDVDPAHETSRTRLQDVTKRLAEAQTSQPADAKPTTMPSPTSR